MTDLAYIDVRPVLAKVADLGRELVLVGGQAVNFWASFYQRRVPALEQEAPFTSKDIDFCGDRRSVGLCAERLGASDGLEKDRSPRRTPTARAVLPWRARGSRKGSGLLLLITDYCVTA